MAELPNWTCAFCAPKRAPYVCTNCGPVCPECRQRSQPFSGLRGFDSHQRLIDEHPGVICRHPDEAGLHWNPERRGSAAWQEKPPGSWSGSVSERFEDGG